MVSRSLGLGANGLVARSLKISRATHMTVVAVVAAVALNATVAIQYLGAFGQAVLLCLIFASVAVGLSAISADLYSRSSQTISNLKSIGASRRSISYALTLSVIGYGAAGAFVGAAGGACLGVALGSGGVPINTLILEVVGVMAIASSATATGVYGGSRIWRS